MRAGGGGARRRPDGEPPRRRSEGERPRRPEGGEPPRRRPDGEPPRRRPEGERPRRPQDGEPPRRRPEGERARRAEGQRRRPAEDPRGRRRAAGGGPRDPRDRENAARSEGRRAPGRGTRAAGGAGGRGGGRRRVRGDEEPDDRPWFKRFLSKAWKPALAFCGLMIIGGVAAFAILYATAPDVGELDEKAETQLNATQIMWASEGEEEEDSEVAFTTGEVNRISVERKEIPSTVISGVLAAEQLTFYEDPGINIAGIGRALLSGGDAGGGSSITQQMARNYYDALSNEQTITRKVREIFIAIKLAQQQEPDEVLEAYLNTIYFGRNASGVEAAAQAYFDKSVGDLDAAEGAFIGMIIQQPSGFANPEPDSWHDRYMRGERWDYMKNQLVELHKINPDLGLSQSEADALEFPEPIEYDDGGESDPKVGYMYNAIVDEVEERYEGIDGTDIATKGYVIETSLDPELMDAASAAFEVLPPGAEDTMFGLTAVRPDTGEIVAFNGGPDSSQVINNSLTHQTQAGSSYKPYVLATALENGIGLRSTFDGSTPQDFPGLASPVNNATTTPYGDVDLIKSTADSINTPFVKLAIEVGEEKVDNLAVEMGVHPDRVTTSTRGPLIALGTHQVNALDQASAYSTFATGGRHYPAHMVTEIRDMNGNVIDPVDKDELENGTEVLNAGVAADATHAMRQVVEGGGGSNAALSDGRPVAGKTGTSSDAVSAWFVGFTPQLSTAVGLSRLGAGPLEFEGIGNSAVFGGSTSAKVWKAFMETAMEGQPVEDFPSPQYVGEEQSFVPTPSPSDDPSEEATEEASEEPTEQESEPECDPNRPGQGRDCESEDPTDEPDQPCGELFQPPCDEGSEPEGPPECNGQNPPDHCETAPPTGEATEPDSNDQRSGGLFGRTHTSDSGSGANRMALLSRED